MLRPEVSASIGAERFLREIKMAARLNHPHILPVYDSGEAGGLLFYVMPNMEGRSLRERLDQQRQLPLEEALRVTREVASALDYAHRQQVVHRDIKPENILLHEGAALVADFGIGKAMSEGGSMTQTGMAIGTPAYMSPEQASGESGIDGRSDLYSLGCVLYEMLTGEPPFTGPTPRRSSPSDSSHPFPEVRITRDVPQEVDEAVNRALSRTPVDRFPTAAEFAEALKGLVRDGRRSTPGIGEERDARQGDRCPPAHQHERRPRERVLQRRDDGGDHQRDGQGAGSAGRFPTSSFAFKGKQTDVREIGEKLGVTSVLEGSVRKVGNRIRITAQLVNVENGYHLWSGDLRPPTRGRVRDPGRDLAGHRRRR